MVQTTKSQTGSNHKSFWLNLQNQIDQYSKRAKKKIGIESKVYYQSQRQKLRNSEPRIYHLNESINSIRQKSRLEKDFSTNIKSKMLYLQTDKNRQIKTAQRAKKKYEKVIEMRNKSLNQKISFEKEKKKYQENYQFIVKQKVLKIRDDRSSISASRKNQQKIAFSQAEEIRKTSLKNQQYISQQKYKKIKLNQTKVKIGQLQQQNSRKKLHQLNQEKIKSGKINHFKKKSQQYQAWHSHSIKNSVLLRKVKVQLTKINMQKIKAQKQLQLYQSYLGIKPKRIPLTQRSKKNSNSFYLTNL